MVLQCANLWYEMILDLTITHCTKFTLASRYVFYHLSFGMDDLCYYEHERKTNFTTTHIMINRTYVNISSSFISFWMRGCLSSNFGWRTQVFPAKSKHSKHEEASLREWKVKTLLNFSSFRSSQKITERMHYYLAAHPPPLPRLRLLV